MTEAYNKYTNLISEKVDEYLTDNSEMLVEILREFIAEHIEDKLAIEDDEIPSWLEQLDALNHEMDEELAKLDISFKVSTHQPKKKRAA